MGPAARGGAQGAGAARPPPRLALGRRGCPSGAGPPVPAAVYGLSPAGGVRRAPPAAGVLRAAAQGPMSRCRPAPAPRPQRGGKGGPLRPAGPCPAAPPVPLRPELARGAVARPCRPGPGRARSAQPRSRRVSACAGPAPGLGSGQSPGAALRCAPLRSSRPVPAQLALLRGGGSGGAFRRSLR